MSGSYLADLLASIQASDITLPQALDALRERGPVSEAQYRADTDTLQTTATHGALDAQALAQLRALLDELRTPAGGPRDSHDDADATVVKPTSTPRVPQDDATVVKPTSAPGAQDGDATVVKPASTPGGGVQDGTIVHPVPGGTSGANTNATGTIGGTGTQSGNSSSWKRVAGEEPGERATVGMLLKGRFILEREIGRGGMGVVYLAKDERKVEARDRDPYVAVKVLNDEFRRHPDSLIALQRESRRSQLLAHDNIVRVFDFDKDGTIVFMTMEYVDGSDLKGLIREQAYDGLPMQKAWPLIEGMARALQRAHRAGVVHSDFKPGNVMVTREGVPKVFDFGIARAGKHAGDVSGEQTVFDAGTLGALTPAYASLEMIQGTDPTPSDDIYALGCVAFELLTGKHPFDKVSAEVAFREGRKPPPVPGLTKRQYRTLCAAVAFKGEDRLKNVQQLIEGLREQSWRERYGPLLIGGGGVIVLLVLGAWGTKYYLHQRHLHQVEAGFLLSNPRHFANEDEAVSALDALSPQDRGQIVLNKADLIQNYLLNRVNIYWNPAQKRYDYAQAQHVFKLRDQLKLFSPKLDARRQAIDQQRNDLLNTLDTQLSKRISNGAIFPNQPDNAVSTLREIRAIDPTSPLLKNAELELKYDIAIGKSMSEGNLAQASSQLKVAEEIFPQSKRLALRQRQLAAAGVGGFTPSAPQKTSPSAPAMSRADALKSLHALLDAPALTSAWQSGVAQASASLGRAGMPAATRDKLGKVIAELAGRRTDALHLPDDIRLVQLGMQYAPKSSPLLQRKAQLETLQNQQQQQLVKEAATAEVASRIESLRRAAAANDLSKARESLNRIRTLDPTNAFLKSTGPQLLAGVYLAKAEAQLKAGRASAAADLMTQAVKDLGARSDLTHARDLYRVAADLMASGGKPLGAIQYLKLHRQLASASRADPKQLKQVESDLKAANRLRHGSLAAWLQALQPTGNTSSAPTPAQSQAPAPTPTPAHAPSTTAPSAGAASKPTASAPAAAPGASGTGTSSATPAAASDPCARAGLAGTGRGCVDHLASGRRGPSLVVIPAIRGGKPYAMTRVEVTVGDFNVYCRTSHACTPKPAPDRESARMPVTDISVKTARAYAAWLTKQTGFTYHLPTNAEWMHAAKAGRGWTQSPDSNCLPPSSDGSDGAGGPISARGRQPNPWGLINLTGNVWEWVTKGGALQVRGGSYNSYWSDCTISDERSDSGKPQKDVGLRLVRDLK